MRTQEQAFRAYYASMTDAELLQTADNRRSFIDLAQKVLGDELTKRKLAVASPPAAVPAHRSILARLAHRVHHPVST